jgi:hypothetical protein
MRRIWGIALLVAAGCGPWKTSIPTYWQPDLRARSSQVPELEEPPVVVEIETPKETWDTVVVPEDTPKECRAIYLVSAQNQLFAFEPETNSFDLRGQVTCPGSGWATPFSMAVDREGIAQVVFNNGALYRVDTKDASCETTSFERNQDGYRRFGMGYAPNASGQGESLFVAEINFRRPSKGLARIDGKTGEVKHIAPFSENPGYAIELTPTGNGPLYGFFINEFERGGTLVEIDTTTAEILSSMKLDVGHRSTSLAVSWFADYFYIFTTHHKGTLVTRFDPETREQLQVATIAQTIVGAGNSTCAPNRARHSAKGSPSRMRF